MMFKAFLRKNVISSAIALTLLTCGTHFSANATELSSLKIGTEASYAPFEFTDHGKLVGFDIDIMEALALEIGVAIEWSPMSFDGLIPALLTSQLDLAIASFTITEERAKRVDFSDPYYRSGLTFVIRAKDKSTYKSASSLKGKHLCAQLGSVSAAKAEKISPNNVTTFSDAPAAYMELKAGGCEAVLNDRPVNQYLLKTTKATKDLVEINEVLDAENMAIVVPKGNQELLAKVNKALANLKSSGKYAEIYKKWFGEVPKNQ